MMTKFSACQSHAMGLVSEFGVGADISVTLADPDDGVTEKNLPEMEQVIVSGPESGL
jgi:hypothetical protein